MKVKFVPQNVEFEIKPGQSVMHVAQDNGLYIKSVCKGVPSCAECRVRVTEGDHNVTPPGSEELSLIGTGYFIDRRRLSCQLKCFGDITIDMTEQIGKQTGLIVGRKKKLTVKDDRVEQAVARRSEEPTDATETEDGADSTVVAERPAQREVKPPSRDSREARPQRENREPRAGSGPSSGRQNQNQARPPQESRGARPQGPGGPGPSRPSGAPNDRPHQPRPQGPEGQAQDANSQGEEGAQGPRKRRRRRGKGGGTPGAQGGPPSRPSTS